MERIDGYWLPEDIRRQIITESTPFQTASFINGAPCDPGTPGSVTARWPNLTSEQWQVLRSLLHAARQRAPQGPEYWERLGAALDSAGKRFTSAGDRLREAVLETIPGYTGYSRAMIQLTLHSLELMSLDQMTGAYALQLERLPTRDWVAMGGLPGRLIFTHQRAWGRLAAGLPIPQVGWQFDTPRAPENVLGYGAGNVPGTALLIAMLAWSTSLAGGPPAAVLVRNSRREAIFTPLVLSALEQVDPQLVAATAVLVWDYEDHALQQYLLDRSDLVIAAAGDDTIAAIGEQVDIANANRGRREEIRFHRHGHKVSFSAISRELLAKDPPAGASQQPLIDILAFLAGLDSVYWDQYGCLSSRMHFIEAGEAGCYTAADYAERLCRQLRLLAGALPRGSAPLRLVKDSFDRYKMLESQAQVEVVSDYQDPFLVVIDRRLTRKEEFYTTVNSCSGRVVIVRPVDDLMDLPDVYLGMIPPENLQSLSVAFGAQGAGLSDRFLKFARACARRGVTAIRTLGRGAFPQLAYSWDGLIPIDLVKERPRGWFSTIEFEDCYGQIVDTNKQYKRMSGGVTDNIASPP